MLHPGGHIQDRSLTRRMLDPAREKDGAAANRVVDLVLQVRRLVIDGAGRQRVETDAQEITAQHGGRVSLGRLPRECEHVLELRGLEYAPAVLRSDLLSVGL